MIFLCSCAIACFIDSKAASETYIQTLSGNHLVAGATCEVKDDKFQNGSVNWNSITNISVNDLITFEIRQDTSLYYYGKPFSATVNLKIAYYTDPDQTTPTILDNVKLKVRFDTLSGHPYPGIAMFKLKGAFRVKVTIKSISSPELGTPLPAIFRLKNEIFIERKYAFDQSINDVTTNSLVRDQLSVSWNPAHYAGAEAYDLEWTHIDDSSAAAASIRTKFTSGGVITVPTDTLEAWMYHNTTRITTAGFGYSINLPYTKGYVIYRVRGVQTGVNDVRKTTNWTYQASQGGSTGSAVVAVPGMDPDLNWQYTGSFAEGGKRKEVVGYFDGTLRNRQSVTINNTENRSIVQETVYDAMGRPAARVLPVPVKDSMLSFFPAFNKNTSGAPYNYINLGQTSSCDITPQAMSVSSGASRYYSPGNTFPKTNTYFFNKYIPDAGGYPFSVTTYTADNTGRISRQGGVGSTFQPGNGHDAQYFYGKPLQSELDRLFGSEAGNAQHFLKNMVVDPNGQVSVSYINASGKTVATALAGTPPANLHALQGAGAAAKNITEDMLSPGNLQYNTGDRSITASASFNVPVPGNYNFNYEVDPLTLKSAYGPGNTLEICSDCYYDLSIVVTDNCGTVVHQETDDAGTVFDSLCAPPSITGSFALTGLPIGSYNIAYKLQVSKAALDFFDGRYVRLNTDLKTLADFTREQIKRTDFGNCFSDCKTCKVTLGTRSSFIARFTLLFDQYGINYDTDYQTWLNHLYDSLYAQCQAIQCPENHSVCYNNYRRMLQDVTPGGQYALYDENYSLLEPDINILRFYTVTTFTDENGQPDYVRGADGSLVPPSSLSLPDFIRQFKPSWADSLVTHHPEYCFYKWCEANTASEEYDDEILNDLTSAAEATAEELYNPQDFTRLFNGDPFFASTGTGNAWYWDMVDSLIHFSGVIGMSSPNYNIMQVAIWASTCGQQGVSIDNCTFDLSCANQDVIWNTYKTFYLKLKNIFYEKTRVANSNCVNCYIGNNILPDSILADPCSGCPVGYHATSEGDYCYKDLASYPSGDQYTACSSVDPTYNMSGTYIYQPGYCIDGVTNFNRSLLAPLSNPLWSALQVNINPVLVRNGNCQPGGQMALPASTTMTATDTTEMYSAKAAAVVSPNASFPEPPMTRCGIWSCNSGPASDKWIGVSQWVYFPETKTYYFGLGADNNFKASIDGVGFIEKTDNNPLNYILWHIYPVVVTAGYHIVSVAGNNNGDVGSFGMEVYDNTPAELAAATQYDDLNILFTTASFIGKPFTSNFYCSPGGVPYTEGGVTGCRYITGETGQVDVPPNSALYADKQRIYDGYFDFTPLMEQIADKTGPELSAETEARATEAARENCTYMAEVWISQLAGCNANASQVEQIREGLIAVCQKGCDFMHQNGVSALPPGVTAVVGSHTYTSFQDVITQILGAGSINRFCNADLISRPFPYDKQLQLSDISVQMTSNTICAKLAALKSQWQSTGFSGTFHEYLQMVLGGDYALTEAQLGELEQGCGACSYFLKENLTLPAYFADGAPGALNCTQVQAALAEVLTAYPSLTPNDNIYQDLIANYLNHKFGYGLTYADYEYFADSACADDAQAKLYIKAPAREPPVDTNACVAAHFGMAVTNASIAYQAYMDSVHRDFRSAFVAKCMNVQPSLTMSGSLWEYQYTLYYYDQAGNLVKTVPPKGVRLLSDAAVDSVQLYRKYGRKDCYRYSNYVTINAPSGNGAYYEFESADNAYTGADPFTIEMWVKLNDLSYQPLAGNFYEGTNPLGHRSSGFALSVTGSKLVLMLHGGYYLKEVPDPHQPTELDTVIQEQGFVNVNSSDISNYVQIGGWTHIVVERTGLKSGAMYVNGIPMPCTIDDNTFSSFDGNISPPPGAPLRIAAAIVDNPEAGSNNVAIKQFRLYRRALSYSEVRQNLFSACLTPSNHTALTVWVPLNGTSIADIAAGTTGQKVGDPSWFSLDQSLWPTYPRHTLATYYQYNSLNEVTRQASPDGGITRHWYDRLGRLLASQTSEQRHPVNGGSAGRYSYTIYDALGRVIEVGEKTGAANLNGIDTKDDAAVQNWLASGSNQQVTLTYYTDNPIPDPSRPQTNLRNRVAMSAYSEDAAHYFEYTLYSYDIAGNVKTIWQGISELAFTGLSNGIKRVDYDYDIISGKVNQVSYQKGEPDQFFYKYTYDADNRVIAAATSRDGLVWHDDARYRYYLHGPLARVELGTGKVQGVDYAYTLQGWLKGINSSFLAPDKDMAGDGNSSGIYAPFARDVYGLTLGYHTSDYTPVGSGANAFGLSYTAPGSLTNTGNQLYNGNISHGTLALSKLKGGLPVGYSYGYDQLNRLLHERQHNIGSGAAGWSNSNIINDYAENIAYDANGNITTYLRNGTTQGSHPLAMDNLTYHYPANSNKLRYITDAVAAGNYPNDLNSQGSSNYAYDSTGNLIKDAAAGISNITWTVYGKPKQVTRSGGSIQFSYDASGNRTVKDATGAGGDAQFYVRDAQGNVLAVYSYDGSTLKWAEQDLYGSSRIGILNWDKALPDRVMLPQSETDTLSDWYLLGSRDYELSNHLGNVLSVISDKKIGVSSGGSTIDYYKVEVLSQDDYYPFGMEQPYRQYQLSSYRYGFNGKEKDDEISGEGNSYDYGMRFYDARVGRFMSVDPLTGKYPELTPYQFASNSPISRIDLDGAESQVPTGGYSDPRQLLYQAGGEISTAFGNMVDKFSFELKVGWTRFSNLFSGNREMTKVSLEKTTKYSVSAQGNFNNYFNYVILHNSNTEAPSAFNIGLTKKSEAAIVTQINIGKLSVTRKVSVDNLAVSKTEATFSLKVPIENIPTRFSISSVQSSSGETFAEFKFGPSINLFGSETNANGSIKLIQNENGVNKVNTSVGGSIKIGNESGIKVFGSGALQFEN